MARIRDRWEDRRFKPPTRRFTSFILLTAPIDQVLMQFKDERALAFPGKLKGDPSKRFRDKYCHFHRGHDNCYDLKQQIEALIRQGKLQRFISKERTDQPQKQAAWRENKCPRPPKRNKDDRRGNHSFQFVQEGMQNLLTDGAERPVDGLHPKDGTDR